MRTTIDSSGRLVVPKSIRAQLHLLGGTEVEISERDGVIEVRPVSADVEVVQTPEGAVVVVIEDVPPLTDTIVDATLDRVRR